MEKYTQFRDRGSGIAPFMPIITPFSSPTLLVHTFVFLCRLPFFLSVSSSYFLFLHHLPLPFFIQKILRWAVLILSGILFVDIQVDGVKRGALSSQPKSRVPHPKSVVASNFTSPIDPLYLAALFDPIFTISYPGTKKVRQCGLINAVLAAFAPAMLTPPDPRQLTTLREILDQNPDRIVVVFPECSTTNGRGVLPLSPSLLTVPSSVDIFPLSIRYTLPDVTTPVPQAYLRFLWALLSRPTTYVRVRLADAVHTAGAEATGAVIETGLNTPSASSLSSDDEDAVLAGERLTPEEDQVLDKIADTLARLGRNRRVGLTLKDKDKFAKAWYGTPKKS